jgi:molybdopterin/thiamine biosynthesis adenylyltransferase
MQTITIVGVGALGSHLIPLLRNLDVSIRIIDFDRVEQKNVMSQFHAKSSVGKAKVVALQQTMQFLFGLKIQVIPHKLTSDNDEQLLSKSDLIIDCLDNGEARRLVQSFARYHDVSCLHGALAADGAFGQVVWDEYFTIDDETNAGAATCENGEHLPFISIVSSYLAKATQLFIEHGKKTGFQIYAGGATRI